MADISLQMNDKKWDTLQVPPKFIWQPTEDELIYLKRLVNLRMKHRNQKYLSDNVLLLQNKIDQFTAKLVAQSSTCPSILPHLKLLISNWENSFIYIILIFCEQSIIKCRYYK
jgi:hypothetical protein